MRIWDLDPRKLCRQHLLGEHRELHALWNVWTLDRSGYRNHPETRRWEGKLAALFARHERLVEEMTRRGYRHRSPLDPSRATGAAIQDILLESEAAQRARLIARGCGCFAEVGSIGSEGATPAPDRGRDG